MGRRKKTPLESWQDERAVKAVSVAAKRNARAAEQHPLFAAMGALEEICEPCTPAAVLAEWDRHEQKLTAAMEEMRRRAEHFRAICARLLDDPELLAVLDDQLRRVYPPGPEYAADFWRKEAQKLLAPGNRAGGK